jgi:C-methyltransferase C-terminal domain/Putative zinc binding domain/Methyltransferase domain
MKRCLVCRKGSAAPLIDFGPQALCNRFLASPSAPQAFFNLTLAQCDACGLVQLQNPVPADELRPRFDWITYNEQEGHLDDLVQNVCGLPGIGASASVGAISFKDDTTVARFQKRGFQNCWRLDPKEDLGIEDRMAGLETVQQRLTPEQADLVAAKRGRVDMLIVRHILEHAQKTPEFANALKRLVKPGGVFIFEVPDCRPALERKDYSMPWEEHVVYFTPRTFRQSLDRLGFQEIQHKCYVYFNENSLVTVARGAEEKESSNGNLAEEVALGRTYAEGFEGYREKVRERLRKETQLALNIALFGAGHLSCFWINALGVKEFIKFVVDDHPKKAGLFMPGSGLPILPSSQLIERDIKLCLLSLSPESEAKVVAKNQAFIERGGSFASMFPGKANSIA